MGKTLGSAAKGKQRDTPKYRKRLVNEERNRLLKFKRKREEYRQNRRRPIEQVESEL